MMLAIKIFIGVLILAGFGYISVILIDPDLGWHVRVGQDSIATGTIPHVDRYTHTMPGFEWVDHEWLVDAWMWWMHAHQVWWAVIIVFTLCAFIPFFVWINRAQGLGQALAVLLGAASVIPFIGVRPQMLSFLLFFITFELSRRYFLEEENKAYLVGFPLLFFVWANLHAGFIAGLVLFGLCIAAGFLSTALHNKKLPIVEYVFPLFVFLLSAASTFLNPYGWKLHAEIVRVFFSPETTKYIMEWQPLPSDLDPALLVFLGVVLVLALRFYKKYSPLVLCVTLFFLVLAFKSARNLPLFVAASYPLIFSGITWLKHEVALAQQQKPFGERTARALLGIAILFFITVIGFFGF
ncbi:hypothetical protein HY250_03780 [Candidatus Azambacteria bacterium]|nr:hypothetical protein [Candidatus Azambacteria bacterium]